LHGLLFSYCHGFGAELEENHRVMAEALNTLSR